MKNMYYLVHLDVENCGFKKRMVSPATQTKASYIVKALNKIGYSVNIISPALPFDLSYDKGGTVQKGNNSITLFPYFGNKGVLKHIISFVSAKFGLWGYFFKNINKNDTVIVYHSLGFLKTLYFLKRIIGFRLILEIEEIYSDVDGNVKNKKKEFKLFKIADAYIFSSKLLNEKINTADKPHIFVYGTYEVVEEKSRFLDDRKIHIVYAGTFDPRKGGAMAAVKSAEFLPENYHLHILGFGSKEDTEKIITTVKDIGSKAKATITYDGCLSGEEYIKFIQSCDIGLSTQNPNAPFNDTSFPSKILSYMSNGLRVVSIKIPAVESSDIGEYVHYYEDQTPEKIAKAIVSIDVNDEYNSRAVIEGLNIKFQEQIKSVLER